MSPIVHTTLVMALFEGTDLWPVNPDQAVNRLKGKGTKEKVRDGACPPLVGIPVVSIKALLAAGVGDPAIRELRSDGYTLTGIRSETVVCVCSRSLLVLPAVLFRIFTSDRNQRLKQTFHALVKRV